MVFRKCVSFEYLSIPVKLLGIVVLSISFSNFTGDAFPFLLSSECYLEDTFLVICNTSFHPPKPFLYCLGNHGQVKIMYPDGNILQLQNHSMTDKVELVETITGAARSMGCHVVRKYSSSRYACKSDHSKCTDTNSTRGYICQCLQGYHGDPYLPGGCKGACAL